MNKIEANTRKNLNNEIAIKVDSASVKPASKWQRITTLSLLKKLLYGTVTGIGIYGSHSIYHVISHQNEQEIVFKYGAESIIQRKLLRWMRAKLQSKMMMVMRLKRTRESSLRMSSNSTRA